MSTAPTKPALRAKFERRREAVIEAAAQVFAERGYDGAGIDDLSAATGLTAGGLYHYIGSKEQLLSEIFTQLMDPLLKEATEIASRSEPAAERLHALIRVWVAHVASHRNHLLVFSQERHLLERDRKRWRQIRASRRRFEEILSGLIDEAVAEAKEGTDAPKAASAGHPSPDVEVIHFALLGMVNYTPQWLKPSGRLDPDRIAEGYSAIISAALSPAV